MALLLQEFDAKVFEGVHAYPPFAAGVVKYVVVIEFPSHIPTEVDVVAQLAHIFVVSLLVVKVGHPYPLVVEKKVVIL